MQRKPVHVHELVKILYCKLPGIRKQLSTFPKFELQTKEAVGEFVTHYTTQLPCNSFVPSFQCSALCGEGTISRDVVCMKKSGRAMAVVGEENCLADDKPKTQKQCRRDPCLPEWYMTEWNEVGWLIVWLYDWLVD